jgi:hypothetical protein
MRVVFSVAALLVFAALSSVLAAEPAAAWWCGWRCQGMTLVPAPSWSTPPPVVPPHAYATVVCGPGDCYWRRDCWYDAFGRRFCN